MSLPLTLSLAFLATAAVAQKPPETTTGKTVGDTIGSPPPLAGPPPISETSSPSKPPANGTAEKGYTGAYTAPGAPTKPYSTGPLPETNTGPGLNVVGADGVSTRAAKAVPCGATARETDGFTTCVGIPDQTASKRRR